jgi:hypothetical protein
VRNRSAWIAATLGAVAGVALRVFQRRRAPEPEPPADPRADELRRKLDESKPIVDERAEFESGETSVDEAAALDEKRASVHERGQAAARQMRDPNAGE